MELTFLYSAGFVREWNRQRFTDDDLIALEQAIAKAPEFAPVIRNAGGLRKIRFAPPSIHRGKSGATRVGFAYFRSKAAVIVVAILMKNEAANFTPAQKSQIEKWLREIERSFR
jgi:hypothetical protein